MGTNAETMPTHPATRKARRVGERLWGSVDIDAGTLGRE
jgi:hypothetical protein